MPSSDGNACSHSRSRFVPRTCIRTTIALSPGLVSFKLKMKTFNTGTKKGENGVPSTTRQFNYFHSKRLIAMKRAPFHWRLNDVEEVLEGYYSFLISPPSNL